MKVLANDGISKSGIVALEKAGFEKDGFGAYNIWLPKTYSTTNRTLSFSGDYLYLRERVNENRFNDIISSIWNKDLMKQFYLHQLQNLYFSLTGIDLNIEL